MYWPQKGPDNTAKTLELVLAKARETGNKHIVVPSVSGESVLPLLGQGLDITCVTHHVGFEGPGVDEMPPDRRRLLVEQGVKVLTTTHLLAGVDRAIKNKFGGIYPAEIMAFTLRIFGQGVKVAVEAAGMALDAGMIPYGKDVISLGGTGQGLDTAIIVRPAHSNNFFDTRVKEIICKPREF